MFYVHQIGSLPQKPYEYVAIPRKKRKEPPIENTADQCVNDARSNHLELSLIQQLDNNVSGPNENIFVSGRRRGRWRTLSSATSSSIADPDENGSISGSAPRRGKASPLVTSPAKHCDHDVASLNENGSVSGRRRRRSRWGTVSSTTSPAKRCDSDISGLNENGFVSESKRDIGKVVPSKTTPSNHHDNNIALKETGHALDNGGGGRTAQPENNEDETLMPPLNTETSSSANSDNAQSIVIPEKLCADMSGWANSVEDNIKELISTVAMVVANVIRDGVSWDLDVVMDSEGMQLNFSCLVSVLASYFSHVSF